MKKNYFIVCLIVFIFKGTAQVIEIPDTNFKNTLLNTLCADTDGNYVADADADFNNDGEIDSSEASQILSLLVANSDISDLTGINSFTQLHYLSCGGNHIPNLTLSNLTQLIELSCSGSLIENLTITNCPVFEIWCSFNSMTSLDLSQTKASKLRISNNENLQYLNVKNGYPYYFPNSKNANSTSDVGPPPLPDLIIKDNPNLTYICCDLNEINEITTHGNFYSPIDSTILVSSYCSIAPGGEYNTINGTVQLNCGSSDAVPYSNQRITISANTDTGVIFTNTSGGYHLYFGEQAVIVSAPYFDPNYFTVTPPSYSYNFTSLGNIETADFCLTANGVHPDLEVLLLPQTLARPGFDTRIRLVYKNNGNQVQSGSATLTFNDAVLDLVSSVPNTDVQSINTLTWNFTNLAPFESRQVDLVFNVNSPQETPPVNTGDILNYEAVLTTSQTDETPGDNQMSFAQPVFNSTDPNDKEVLEGAQIGEDKIDDYLHYIVRFQNTGTAAAENIVVKDMLDANLDWSTLQMVSSSHPYRSTLTSGNKLEVFYQGINLPASSVDEEGSHGYIAFKVKPKNTVVVNDVIANTADIYFDFNFPIVTNTVTTTITALGTPAFSNNKSLVLYPNPATNTLNVSIADGASIKQITITNTLGQIVLYSTATTLDVSRLNGGTYFATVATDTGKTTQKFIKL